MDGTGLKHLYQLSPSLKNELYPTLGVESYSTYVRCSQLAPDDSGHQLGKGNRNYYQDVTHPLDSHFQLVTGDVGIVGNIHSPTAENTAKPL